MAKPGGGATLGGVASLGTLSGVKRAPPASADNLGTTCKVSCFDFILAECSFNRSDAVLVVPMQKSASTSHDARCSKY